MVRFIHQGLWSELGATQIFDILSFLDQEDRQRIFTMVVINIFATMFLFPISEDAKGLSWLANIIHKYDHNKFEK